MFQKTILVFVLVVLLSCKEKTTTKDKIKTADWLIGKWENKNPDGTLNENWKKVNDSTFSGTSSFLKRKDTIHHETISLTQKGEELIYIATIKGQNDDAPVSFLATLSNEKQLIFENPKNDYPQKIIYTKGNNSLVAEISGKLEGKLTTERFILTKK